MEPPARRASAGTQARRASEGGDDAFPAGAHFYAALCGAALLAAALPLLGRGMGAWALFPSLLAGVAVLARWRTGPALFLFGLVWLVLADRVGHSPGLMAETLLGGLASLLSGALHRPPLRDFLFPRLQEAVPLLDVLVAAAFVVYTAAHYRLVSVTRHVFPIDRRRRVRPPGAGTVGRRARGPVLKQKRSAGLFRTDEAGPLLFAAVASACLAEFLWLWLSDRSLGGDVLDGTGFQRSTLIPDDLWRLFVLVGLFSLFLIPITGILAYLGQRRLSPEESALYLQDQLWRQTRREQARLSRWLAWAVWRQRRRQEARAARARRNVPLPPKEKS